MPTPVPAPSSEQIVRAAVIAMVTTDEMRDAIESAGDGETDEQDISNAKWAIALEYIERWTTVGSASGNIKRIDVIEFFEGQTGSTRLDLRNEMRALYGFDPLLSETTGAGVNMQSLEWFDLWDSANR